MNNSIIELKAMTMVLNYLITAWRSLLKNRIISLINIGGLTIGLASAVLAILFAKHELTYEDCHKNVERICRLYIGGDFDQIKWLPTNFGPEGLEIKDKFPEVDNFTRAYEADRVSVRVGENIFFEENVYGVDSSYFSILTVPFVQGKPSQELNTVVVSQKVATRYFGSSNPIGQTMQITHRNVKNNFVVTGVYNDLPSNTHIKAEILIPFNYFRQYSDFKPEEYHSSNFITFFLLKPFADYKVLNSKIEETIKIPIDLNNVKPFLIPLKEVHMRGTWENNRGKLLIFFIGGFFVLIITCLNYINLTNILFSTRNKEVGIRKVNGAMQKHIFLQFLSDTVLSTVIAFNLAIVAIKLALPWFNSLMDTNIELKPATSSLLLLLLLLIATIVLSGLYPALRYSFQKPVDLIKPVTTVLGGKGFTRRILTTFQFFLAIIFIQFMMALNMHGNYLADFNTKRYNSDNVYCISGNSWGDLRKVKEELQKSPLIEGVTWGSSVPQMGGSLTKEWKDKDNKSLALIAYFEEDYTNVFRIDMPQGRFYSEQYRADKEQNVIINKLAADAMGYTDPIGQKFTFNEKEFNVIGIVDLYRAVPPIFDIMPMIIRPADSTANFLAIRIVGQQVDAAKYHIKSVLSKFNPDLPIELSLHSDLLVNNKTAKTFISATQLMNLFFYLTIISSLVGLFGLSLFIAQRNRHEVGVRKVLGATTFSIMLRLSKGLIIQVLIAILLATPVSMMSIKGYLSIFPDKFKIGLPLFLIGGVVALILVLLTVGWQTYIAAKANPTVALRSE